MKLSRLLEAEQTAKHPTDHKFIRARLEELELGEEDMEWTITPEGIVREGSDTDPFDFIIPEDWTRIPVKFGDFPSASYKLYKTKLGSLENSPTAVKSMVMQGGIRMASLKGGPAKVKEHLSLIDCSLTSLAGAPEEAGFVLIKQVNRLTTLQGLENTSTGQLDILECSGLTSFEGMPKYIDQNIFIDDLEACEAIRFPQYVTMGSGGAMYIGGNIIHKLSPTLVTVPGLTSIDWISSYPYRKDILALFNKYLKLPKTIHTYLGLQTELIDRDMDWLADL